MKNANLTAMPNSTLDRSGLSLIVENTGGLTKLEYFAAMAMQGVLANPNCQLPNDGIAYESLAVADALLAGMEK